MACPHDRHSIARAHLRDRSASTNANSGLGCAFEPVLQPAAGSVELGQARATEDERFQIVATSGLDRSAHKVNQAVSRRHPLHATPPAPQWNRDDDREEDGQWESSHFRRFPTAVLAGRHRRPKYPRHGLYRPNFPCRTIFRPGLIRLAKAPGWSGARLAPGFESPSSLPRESAATPFWHFCHLPEPATLPRTPVIGAECSVSHGRVAVRGGIGPPGATTASRGPTRSTESPGPRTSAGASGADRG